MSESLGFCLTWLEFWDLPWSGCPVLPQDKISLTKAQFQNSTREEMNRARHRILGSTKLPCPLQVHHPSVPNVLSTPETLSRPLRLLNVGFFMLIWLNKGLVTSDWILFQFPWFLLRSILKAQGWKLQHSDYCSLVIFILNLCGHLPLPSTESFLDPKRYFLLWAFQVFQDLGTRNWAKTIYLFLSFHRSSL